MNEASPSHHIELVPLDKMMTTDRDGTSVLKPIESISLLPITPSQSLVNELRQSTELVFQGKLMWLLVLGPIALVADATGYLGEAACFACSGVALIPCAERLSFVTEQVAAHTNGTIGALLNATFGNAPELLISTAALRAGFYRVVQLAMLGSMLTNLLFVFGAGCLVGGLRWQVQELRITSGNVSVLMLLAATAGSLLPAALSYSGEMRHHGQADDDAATEDIPTRDELRFCRVNAAIMMVLYLSYLVFQLGTHKEEFDEDENVVEANGQLLLLSSQFASRTGKRQPRRNQFCLPYFCWRSKEESSAYKKLRKHSDPMIVSSTDTDILNMYDQSSLSSGSEDAEPQKLSFSPAMDGGSSPFRNGESRSLNAIDHVLKHRSHDENSSGSLPSRSAEVKGLVARTKTLGEKRIEINDSSFRLDGPAWNASNEAGQMTLRAGVLWLLIITLCISAMSDILVETIEGFAYTCNISEVFTSMVIIPFFSNIAEQVSAIIFAYHNKMDLCVGVTVGSAIQIAMFVLPGCVLIGLIVDRSMTLYFRGFETCCLFFGVICVAAVLQGGTTNWLVGATLIGIYVMIATGIWFHELEDLSTDAELAIQNRTMT